jgi:hypothetical protein
LRQHLGIADPKGESRFQIQFIHLLLGFRSSGGRQKSIEHLNDLTVSIPPVILTQADDQPIPRLSVDRPEVFMRRQSAQVPVYDQVEESAKTEADLLLRGRPTSQI